MTLSTHSRVSKGLVHLAVYGAKARTPRTRDHNQETPGASGGERLALQGTGRNCTLGNTEAQCYSSYAKGGTGGESVRVRFDRYKSRAALREPRYGFVSGAGRLIRPRDRCSQSVETIPMTVYAAQTPAMLWRELKLDANAADVSI